MTQDQSGHEPAEADVRVSEVRLQECCRDAHCWARNLPEYADRPAGTAHIYSHGHIPLWRHERR
jgi:hypothetical protein